MTLILYHAKWCGHCKTFMGKDGGWKKLKQMRDRGFKLKAIEEGKIPASKRRLLLGYPTIELQTKASTKVYKGDRSVSDIIAFVKRNLRKKRSRRRSRRRRGGAGCPGRVARPMRGGGRIGETVDFYVYPQKNELTTREKKKLGLRGKKWLQRFFGTIVDFRNIGRGEGPMVIFKPNSVYKVQGAVKIQVGKFFDTKIEGGGYKQGELHVFEGDLLAGTSKYQRKKKRSKKKARKTRSKGRKTRSKTPSPKGKMADSLGPSLGKVLGPDW